jgi:hypothetical protein
MIVGSGEGLLASGGKSIAVRWSKASDVEPVVLSTEDGTEVKLAPGITWVELVPSGQGHWTTS